MTTQSEQALETGLIKTLEEMNYEFVSIKEEDNEKHRRYGITILINGLPIVQIEQISKAEVWN